MMDSFHFRPRTAVRHPVIVTSATMAFVACVLDGPVSENLEAVCAQFQVIDVDSVIPDTVGIDDTLQLSIQAPGECLMAPASRFLWSSSDETKAVVSPVAGDTAAFVRGVALAESAEFASVEILTRLIAPDLDTGFVRRHSVTVVPKLVIGDLVHPTSGEVIDTSLDIGAAFDIVAEVHNSTGRLETANDRIELQLGFRTGDGTFIQVFDFAEDTSGNKIGTFVAGSVSRFANDGVASFENVKIFTPGIGYQLRARSGGLTAATSRRFDVGFVRPEFSVQPSSTVAGQVIAPAVTIRLLDERGAPVTDVVDSLILSVSDVEFVNGPVIFAPVVNGIATFNTVTVCEPGSGYRLTARLLKTVGSLTDTSDPFDIAVGPADADSSRGNVPPGDVGDTTVIEVRTRDTCGNPVTTGMDSISVTITGANDVTPEVMHRSGNVYEAAYEPTNRGRDDVAIVLNGMVLSGSPFESPVGSGGVPSRSTADVPGSGTAGIETAIDVVVRRMNDDQVTVGGDDVVVQVSGANPGTVTVTDNDDGTYSAAYTPTVAGQDQIDITVNGSPVRDNPFISTVVAGPAVAANTIATVPDGTAGTETVILIESRDVFDNRVTIGGATVVVEITGANAATATVSDEGDGTYVARYTPANSGSDTIVIQLNGAAIRDSPFTSTVGSE